MTDNVIHLCDRGFVRYDDDEPPAELLEKAKEWGLKAAIVIGFDADGAFCWGGSIGDLASINILADLLKQTVLIHLTNGGENL